MLPDGDTERFSRDDSNGDEGREQVVASAFKRRASPSGGPRQIAGA